MNDYSNKTKLPLFGNLELTEEEVQRRYDALFKKGLEETKVKKEEPRLEKRVQEISADTPPKKHKAIEPKPIQQQTISYEDDLGTIQPGEQIEYAEIEEEFFILGEKKYSNEEAEKLRLLNEECAQELKRNFEEVREEWKQESEVIKAVQAEMKPQGFTNTLRSWYRRARGKSFEDLLEADKFKKK